MFIITIFIIQSIFWNRSSYSFDGGQFNLQFWRLCLLASLYSVFGQHNTLSLYVFLFLNLYLFPSLIQKLFHGSRNFSRRAPIHLFPGVLVLWNSHWTLYRRCSNPLSLVTVHPCSSSLAQWIHLCLELQDTIQSCGTGSKITITLVVLTLGLMMKVYKTIIFECRYMFLWITQIITIVVKKCTFMSINHLRPWSLAIFIDHLDLLCINFC